MRYCKELRLFQENITNIPTPLSVLSSHSQTPTPPTERLPEPIQLLFPYERVPQLLELFEKIFKEQYSGDA